MNAIIIYEIIKIKNKKNINKTTASNSELPSISKKVQVLSDPKKNKKTQEDKNDVVLVESVENFQKLDGNKGSIEKNTQSEVSIHVIDKKQPISTPAKSEQKNKANKSFGIAKPRTGEQIKL